MTNMQRMRAVLAGMALTAGAAMPAAAVEFDEIGNATRFFNGAVAPQDVGPGIDVIHGSISGGDQGDLFKLVFDVGGDLLIRGRRSSGALQPVLFLFDAAGAGLRADLGGASGTPAVISIAILPGTYYIGIGDAPLHAVDTDGTVWDGTLAVDSPPPADFGTLDFLDQVGTIVSPGNYRIFLSLPTAGIPVAEPAALALLGFGVAGLCAARRRGRAATPPPA